MSIFQAIINDNWNAFQDCLKDTRVLESRFGGRESFLSTPLWQACYFGRWDMVRALLDVGADATTKDTREQTCLHAVLRCTLTEQDRLVETIQLLVAAGADPEAKDQDGLKAYDYIGKFNGDHTHYIADIVGAFEGALDPVQVVFNRNAGAVKLKEVYMFDLRERITYALAPGTNAVTAICRDSFVSIGDTPALREAFAEHQKRGGALSEADIISPVQFGLSSFGRK